VPWLACKTMHGFISRALMTSILPANVAKALYRVCPDTCGKSRRLIDCRRYICRAINYSLCIKQLRGGGDNYSVYLCVVCMPARNDLNLRNLPRYA
jgi:hypothetical protein